MEAGLLKILTASFMFTVLPRMHFFRFRTISGVCDGIITCVRRRKSGSSDSLQHYLQCAFSPINANERYTLTISTLYRERNFVCLSSCSCNRSLKKHIVICWLSLALGHSSVKCLNVGMCITTTFTSIFFHTTYTLNFLTQIA